MDDELTTEYAWHATKRIIYEYIALLDRIGDRYHSKLVFRQIGKDHFIVSGHTNMPLESISENWELAKKAAQHPLRPSADLSHYEKILDEGSYELNKE